MQVSVEINNLECQMTVGLPRTRLDTAMNKRLKELARTTKINGFRPGKSPIRLIKQRFGKEVRNEILGELFNESFQEAITEKNLRPAGMPDVKFEDETGNSEEFSYTAKFEIYPEVENIALDGIQVEKSVAEVTENDIDKMVQKLRQQRQTWEAVERAAENGDQLEIDFVGTLEGEEAPFEGGSANGHHLELGKNQFIPGFEEALVGAMPGSEQTVALQFPEEYNAEALAGKNVSFKVTVHQVNAPSLPEINEDFIKAFGVADGTMDSFRAEVRNNLSRELEAKLSASLKQNVLDALLEKNEIQVPNAAVTSEAEQLKKNMEAEFAQQGIQAEQLSLTVDQFRERAITRVKLGILMGTVIRQENFTPAPEKVKAAVEKLASTYEHPESVISWFYSDPANLHDIEASVLEDQIVDWVLEKVEVSEVAKNFAEVMEPEAEAAVA
ncbi:trigger factor [Candidatus Venteria ishoeyi]|uniref:Trigger factor n=1 Tax=Candidatus Venteria ishoeyi TaxID=1899563 RepID=A0A1H6FGS7_9GAMM|nr:trigger factor [Candidatus Venteria ishoeyi]MDM8547089.1 trigger factor [Candidatus Venteria ishoeyi]SEH08235.1 Trigger factor [Candidatus Venteria ishoeyi]